MLKAHKAKKVSPKTPVKDEPVKPAVKTKTKDK